MKLKSWLPLFLTLLLLLNVPTLFLKSTLASPTATLKILDPVEGDTSITYTHAAPPPTATNYPLGYVIVNVSVFNIDNLASWQINITWDPTLLEIANKAMNADMYLPSDNIFGTQADFISNDISDNSAYFAVGIKLGSSLYSFNGSGRLCVVKFNVTKAPSEGEVLSCTIHFALKTEYPIYTKLVDPDSFEIDYTPEDGYYEYKWPYIPPPSEGAAFAVKPPEIINSSILPPQTIQLNVTMKNVTDMYGYGFSLNYDSGILWCISLTILDVLGETNYIPQFSVDNTKGIITVNVTYIPPAVPITTEQEVPLVALVFRVKGIGATLLHLNNTNLVDSLGRPIPHVAHDGLFANIIRDLAVTNVVTSRDWVYQGNQIKINVTVKNQGEVTETSITVTVYYEDNMLGNAVIASLNPSEEVKLTFTWDTKTVTPCRNYTISANVTVVPYELNLMNNIFIDGKVKVRYYGDVNGDGVVDIQDLQLVKNAIPSDPEDPRWNPYADVNDDQLIDIVDYQRVKRQLGKACP